MSRSTFCTYKNCFFFILNAITNEIFTNSRCLVIILKSKLCHITMRAIQESAKYIIIQDIPDTITITIQSNKIQYI